MSVRKFRFVQLDVFTDRPLEGNQLAVFSDARGLSDEEMQKLARETNLSETTYILPREEAVERKEGHRSAFSPSMKSCRLQDTRRSVLRGICASTRLRMKSFSISRSARYRCGLSSTTAGSLARCSKQNRSSGARTRIPTLPVYSVSQSRSWMKAFLF